MRHCDVDGRENEDVLLDGYLNSHFQTGLKNLLDRAILDSPDFHEQALIEQVQEARRDSVRLHPAHDVGGGAGSRGKAILLTKGAPEEIFHHCSHFELDGEVVADGPQPDRRAEGRVRRASATMAFGCWPWRTKELPAKQAYAKDDERDLVLQGLRRVSRSAQGHCAAAPSRPCTSTASR